MAFEEKWFRINHWRVCIRFEYIIDDGQRIVGSLDLSSLMGGLGVLGGGGGGGGGLIMIGIRSDFVDFLFFDDWRRVNNGFIPTTFLTCLKAVGTAADLFCFRCVSLSEGRELLGVIVFGAGGSIR